MNFNGIDLSIYGLTILRTSMIPRMPNIRLSHVEIADKAHDFRAYLGIREIRLEVKISSATLQDDLDNISQILNPTEGLKKLILDVPDDRYYMAKVADKIDYELIGSKLALGNIAFICPDPLAYDVNEVGIGNDYSINAAEKTITETTGGTGYINPVYILTAKEDLGIPTIKLKNLTIGEELQWTGSLTTDNELEVDTANWIVKKNSVVDMSTISGQFPRLLPSTANSIKVTALYSSVAGNLNITYRNRYL